MIKGKTAKKNAHSAEKKQTRGITECSFTVSECFLAGSPGDYLILQVSSVQFSHSVMSNSLPPVDCSTPCFPVHHQLLEPIQTHVYQIGDPSNHLILCHPLLLLPSVVHRIKVFSNELTLHIRWPKYQSLIFSNSLSNKYSGFISFRIGWLDLLAVQGTLKRFSCTATSN